MSNILLRMWNWTRRFRNRCGYGVHSPSDFFLITFVIYERLPYYAYDGLHELYRKFKHLPNYREKVNKLLFRLVNYFRPSLLLEVGTGSGVSTQYLAAGNTQMKVVTSTQNYTEEVKKHLSDNQQICYIGDNLDEMVSVLKESNLSSVMVHIAHTSNYKQVYETLVPFAGEKTCFIIGQPYADKIKKKWWREIVEDERTGVTFDLYDLGIVLFDKRRVKEHRIVNFF